MSRRVTSTVIATGMALSLLVWGARQLDGTTLSIGHPDNATPRQASTPHFSVQFSFEVHP